MNEIARKLRAQIPSSTDPERLERMANEAERRAALATSAAPEERPEAGEARARLRNH
jgi:hypothetical protein